MGGLERTLQRRQPALPSPTAALLREKERLERMDAELEAQHLKATTQAAVEKVCVHE